MGVYTSLIILGGTLIVALLFGIYLIIKKAFNIKVQIYEQTAGGIVVSERKAKKIERPDGSKLQFFSIFKAGKEYMALPTGDNFFLTKKRDRKSTRLNSSHT